MAPSPKIQQERASCLVRIRTQWEHPSPGPWDPCTHTSKQLEGTAENIQGAHEQVEEPQEQKELPEPFQDAQNLPFGVSIWGREKNTKDF